MGYALVLTALLGSAAFAQTTGVGRCVASAVPTPVRAEGLTERVGDILLQCTGLTAGSTFTGTLALYLPVLVTNRVDSAGRTTEVVVTVNGTPQAIAGVVSANTLTFAGLTFPVPGNGAADLRITNLRAAVSQGGAGSPLVAGISIGLPLDRAQVTVALPQWSMLASRGSSAVACYGSELPRNISLDTLIASGTLVASSRVTEGYASAFEPRSASTDTGTRFLLRFSGFPAGTQLAAPDFVAGNNALTATRGGDLGGAPSTGQYQPGSGTLLLARVIGADPAGSGGVAQQFVSGGGAVVLNGASTLTLTDGAGYLVYEVLDASPAIRENAQIPVYLGIPGGAAGTVAYERVSLAPLSTSTSVPRFADVTPPDDCVTLADCELLLPKLAVSASPSPMNFTAVAGQKVTQDPGDIAARNVGTGVLVVEFRVEYAGSHSGWLVLDPPYPTSSKRVFINTAGLAPGTYKANVIVDAGQDGGETIPVTLVITAAPVTPPPTPTPTPIPVKPVTITRIVNGASLAPAPVVVGSLSVIEGTNLAGALVAVTFDGAAAQIIGSTATEIRVRVPDLGAKTSAQVVVTVDGVASAPHYASVALVWPAIFPNGLYNQDSTLHRESNPAAAGSIVQVFATGLPGSGAGITARIHDREGLVPVYSGAVQGVQQLNVRVPSDLPPMSTYLSVCGAGTGGAVFCSPGIAITIR